MARGGYTIIEVMIFLTVSAVLFVSVVGAMSAQSRRKQFTESVETFNQKLTDILNDVDTGYFPSSSDFKCTIDASGKPSFTVGTTEQGKNDDCIFAGKSITVNSSDKTKFDVQTLVGRRVDGSKKDVSSISEANLVALTGTTAGSDSGSLSADVQIVSIRSFNDSNHNSSTVVNGFGVITGFGQQATGVTMLKSGAIKSQLAVASGGNWSSAPNGIILCLAEGDDPATGRIATIKIGAGFSQQQSVISIDSYEGCG